jgi:hypothetical protein
MPPNPPTPDQQRPPRLPAPGMAAMASRGPPVDGQGLCLPAAAVERQHQLAPQPLPHRLCGDQRLQLLRRPRLQLASLCNNPAADLGTAQFPLSSGDIKISS